MESSLKVNFKVGAFVFIGLIVILGSIFLLGANKSLFTKHARLNATFDQVQGLARGSVISLSGVTIGNIEEIDFIDGGLNVVMKIETEFLSRIPKGSQVEIKTQGALGDKFIYIIPNTTAKENVSDGDRLEAAKSGDIFNVIAERGKDTEKIFDIINEVVFSWA